MIKQLYVLQLAHNINPLVIVVVIEGPLFQVFLGGLKGLFVLALLTAHLCLLQPISDCP